MKLYIVLAAWPITKNNHAGMFYLAKKFKETCKHEVKIYKLPVWKIGYMYPLYRLYAIFLGLYLRFKVKSDDIVWLMEYLLKKTEQSDIARILGSKVKIIGLAHLIPRMISKQYSPKDIKQKINYLDKLYVFGSSLKDFLLSNGVENNKVTTTFHYVDTNFYCPSNNNIIKKFTVICMGNMERNYSDLKEIIDKCPFIEFIICAGRNRLDGIFATCQNVTLFGYISEEELLHLMQNADVSLNVMNDTIGSNVIVSSLACGLPILASNVGSIKDYVNEGINGMLFNTPQEAIRILHKLNTERLLLNNMKSAARKKSEEISIGQFIEFFLKDNNLC